MFSQLTETNSNDLQIKHMHFHMLSTPR